EAAAASPLQLKAAGELTWRVCPKAIEMPVVAGCSVIVATSVIFIPYPAPLQYFASGLRVQPEIEIPAGTARHNKQTSVKNRRMNPPRPASSIRGTVFPNTSEIRQKIVCFSDMPKAGPQPVGESRSQNPREKCIRAGPSPAGSSATIAHAPPAIDSAGPGWRAGPASLAGRHIALEPLHRPLQRVAPVGRIHKSMPFVGVDH